MKWNNIMDSEGLGQCYLHKLELLNSQIAIKLIHNILRINTVYFDFIT